MPAHFWKETDLDYSARPPQAWLNVIGSMNATDVRHVAGNGCPLMFSTLALLYILVCSKPTEHPQPLLVSDIDEEVVISDSESDIQFPTRDLSVGLGLNICDELCVGAGLIKAEAR